MSIKFYTFIMVTVAVTPKHYSVWNLFLSSAKTFFPLNTINATRISTLTTMQTDQGRGALPFTIIITIQGITPTRKFRNV